MFRGSTQHALFLLSAGSDGAASRFRGCTCCLTQLGLASDSAIADKFSCISNFL